MKHANIDTRVSPLAATIARQWAADGRRFNRADTMTLDTLRSPKGQPVSVYASARGCTRGEQLTGSAFISASAGLHGLFDHATDAYRVERLVRPGKHEGGEVSEGRVRDALTIAMSTIIRAIERDWPLLLLREAVHEAARPVDRTMLELVADDARSNRLADTTYSSMTEADCRYWLALLPTLPREHATATESRDYDTEEEQ